MLSKILKATISVILALSICIVTCTAAFAASSKERYISELVICSASSADEAEEKLKEQGYKLMSSENLNESLSDGMYLGYKTTTDKDEAITDISAMNMNGKYSFSDYEILLDKMKENVSATVDGLIPMITSYRTNYNSGSAVAVEVHDILNKFYEDDSGEYMGDYLLTCDLKDTTDITKVFLQGYSSFIINIQQLLFLAGENDSDKKWIEKMSGSDTDSLVDLYLNTYPTPNKAYSALTADYGNAAEIIRTTWDVFYENLSSTKSKYFLDGSDVEIDTDTLDEKIEAADNNKVEITDDMTADEICDAVEKTTDKVETYDNLIDVNLVCYLDSLNYGDGTMLDFFMRPSEEVEDMELYTLAYYMGEKLTAQVNNVGLQQVISRVTVDGDNATTSNFEQFDEFLSAMEKISIYDGVDRSLFENGVALTSASTEKYQSSGKDWSEDLFSRVFQPKNDYKWTDYFAFYVLPIISSFITVFALQCVSATINKHILSFVNKGADGVIEVVKESKSLELIFNDPQIEHALTWKTVLYGKGTAGYAHSALYRGVQYLKVAFFAFMCVWTVVSIVMLFVTIFSDEDIDAKYSAVPNHIVDTVNTENGDDYIAYNYVKNLSGSAGDLNNYVGKNGWLVLFYTKDSSVGEPIKADMKIVKGSATAPLDYENVSMFGETNAINLTSKDYTGKNDTAKGTYMYFSRTASATTGSVFSNSNFAIAVGVGVAIGIIIGAFLPKPKKKKETAIA